MKKLTTLILMVVVCGAVWGQIDDTSINQRWKTSHTGGNNGGKWTKLAECNIVGAWQDCGATFDFFGNGGGGQVFYYGQLVSRFKNQNSSAQPINHWKLILKDSNLGAHNIKAVRNNTKVEIYIRIPESHTSIYFRRILTGGSSITALHQQPFLDELPSGDLVIDCEDGDNTIAVNDRFQIGNTNSAFKSDVVTGFSNGIAPTDAALFVPLNNSSISDLRLYIPDDYNDAFSIWGNTCAGGNCGDLNSASQVVKFRADGNVYFNGKVGIGNTGDPQATLDVNGNIKAHEIEVTLAAMQDLQLNGTLAANNITYTANGNTADFVFEDNYHLKDLSEVEAFIKSNKHLPEIPSATEMEEAGVNLAEMNKLLLMKVEELTLYSIQLEKEVEAVRSSESEVRREMEKMTEDRRRETDEMKERLSKLEALLLK
ncbi:MAG: hypothetical protein N4A74_22245 [Carboxylicivirga sp.]|jgi:hypothetical protein|nr:hypothetical protein [Carboxylicivirga sp.]